MKVLTSYLAHLGTQLSESVGAGDVIAVEVDDPNEPWMISRVECTVYTAEAEVQEADNSMGTIGPGDQIMGVVKLEPIASGPQKFRHPSPNALSAKAYKAKWFVHGFLYIHLWRMCRSAR